MSGEGGYLKMDSKKIKDVLRHHSELTQQIHKQVLEIREKLDEVQQQTIEMASYPKIDLSQEGGGRGTHKDLADVYLRYQKLVNEQEEQLAAEMHVLTIHAEGIHRLYLCFQTLIGEEHDIIDRLYVKGELYKSVEQDMGLNHRIFEGKRKDYMQERSMASEQAIRNVESKMTEIKNANHEMDSLPSSLKYIGAAVGAVLLSVLAVVVQAVFSFLAVIIGVIIAILVPIIVVVTIISTLIGIIASLMSSTPVIAGGGERIVQIALQEENNPSGAKYWRYVMGSQFVNGDVTPWCACFVSWCANEAGLIDSGIVPKAAAVRAYHRYYAERGRFHYASEGYTPQPGDFIVFGADTHIGIVQYVENGRVVTIEGNTSDAVHSRSYALNSSYVTGYCNPEYPAGTTIEIPEGMGTTHTYMGWRTITSRTSLQYQLREQSGEHYDSEGFGIIDGRYVIACTTLYGQVGDYVDFYRENGDVLHCVIGDIKNQNDPGCNQYGHQNGERVVEFVVQYSTWYPSHANPGTPSCKPEWNSRVVKAVNLGYNYFH